MSQPKRKKRCNCHFCQQSAAVKKAVEGRSLKAMRKMIEHLFGELIQAEEDNSYYQAIIGGSWDSAIEQLEHSLIMAKKYKEESDRAEREPQKP